MFTSCHASGSGRRLPRIGLFFLFLVGLLSAATLEAREVRQYSIEEFLGSINYFGASFSPDNSKILVSSDASGIFNAYALPVAGGEPEPLTRSTTESIFAIGYFPSDERILYSSDQGGNELDHVFVRAPDGTARDLTPGEGLKAQFYGWARDDGSFFIGTNERDERYFDVYEYDVDSYEREMIYRNDEGYEFADVSPDRRLIALHKVVTNADSDIYLHDREAGETRLLTPHEGEINYFPETFSADGKSLYYRTDDGHEFVYLVRHDLEADEREVVVKEDWGVQYGYLSKTGRYLVVGINNDARTELRIYETATGKRVSLPRLPEAEITSVGISPDETLLSFYASSSRMPRDLFVYDFSGADPRRLTSSLNENIDPDDLVTGKVVRFDSFDGVEVPGILYRPHQADPENRVPALVWVHGGPGGQSRLGYSALIQYLVNHGYAIYEINNRGSSGYGKTFYHMDDRKHGQDDLDDCVASKKMLAGTGFVDPERIGILGGSYGGYMVLAALTFRPEAFDVGVDLFGISNWYRTLQSIPPWWESFRVYLEKEMGDFDDEEFFRAKSPLFHAENIRRPLMVLQGANDPRVIKAESDDIVKAARANGVPVEYVVFEDEGHGFVKKENRIEGYEAILRFLDRHLKAEEKAEAAGRG
jgi:dipeptidyl aminopeptidase/acylaminoacyl peptidase